MKGKKRATEVITEMAAAVKAIKALQLKMVVGTNNVYTGGRER